MASSAAANANNAYLSRLFFCLSVMSEAFGRKSSTTSRYFGVEFTRVESLDGRNATFASQTVAPEVSHTDAIGGHDPHAGDHDASAFGFSHWGPLVNS